MKLPRRNVLNTFLQRTCRAGYILCALLYFGVSCVVHIPLLHRDLLRSVAVYRTAPVVTVPVTEKNPGRTAGGICLLCLLDAMAKSCGDAFLIPPVLLPVAIKTPHVFCLNYVPGVFSGLPETRAPPHV